MRYEGERGEVVFVGDLQSSDERRETLCAEAKRFAIDADLKRGSNGLYSIYERNDCQYEPCVSRRLESRSKKSQKTSVLVKLGVQQRTMRTRLQSMLLHMSFAHHLTFFPMSVRNPAGLSCTT